jgi:hypothetical protein
MPGAGMRRRRKLPLLLLPTPIVIVNTRRILDLVRLDNDDRSWWSSLTVPLLLLNHSEWENDSDDRDSRMARHQL